MTDNHHSGRQVMLLTAGIVVALILLVAGILSLGGALSWLELARALMASAAVVVALELLLLQRILSDNPCMYARRHVATCRPYKGCSLIFLMTLVAITLFACGAALHLTIER